MKRGIIIVIVFLGFLLIGNVGAANSCVNSDQIILKLEDDINAHGEVWNGVGAYVTEICYNEIPGFIGAYTPTLGVHTCGVGNLALRLSDNTNAHGQGPLVNTYSIDVCHEGLADCVLEDVGVGNPSSCSSGSPIVRLSDITNANMEIRSFTNYRYVLCCKEFSSGPPPPPPGAAFWADMLNNPLPDGSDVFIGNSVKLIATGVPGPAGTSVTFEIFDDDAGFPRDNIKTGLNALTSSTDASGRAEAVWQITQADYDAGKADEAGGSPELELYFETSATGFFDTSPIINLHNTPENTPPVSIISSPMHRQIYFTNTQLEFNQSSYDIDGIITAWEWAIIEDGFTSIESNFTHSFSTAGLKTITLKVRDNQGKTGEAQIAILLIESPGMLAFINKPYHLEIVRDPGLIVQYLANDSYVVNRSATCSMDCLAGNCPLQTGNSPSACGGGPIPVNNAPQDFSSLYFNWTFSSQGQNFGFNTGGFGNESGQHRYGLFSSSLNDKLIVLNLSYFDTNLHEKVERIFTLLSGGVGDSACVGNQLWEFDNSGNLARVRNIIGDTESPTACFGPNGVYDGAGGDDCTCPSPFYCNPTGEGCVASKITSCSNYTDESNCNNDTYQVAKPGGDPLWDLNNCNEAETAEGIKDCFCGWRPSGICEFIVNVTPWKVSSGGAICSYECGYLSIEDPAGCVEGYIDLSVESNFVAGSLDPSCDYTDEIQKCNEGAGEHKLPCGRPEIALPFFGMMQFGISFVFVLIIYLLIIHRHVFKED